VKAFCLEKGLTRGRTNHNLGRRVTYLECKELGGNAKTRIVQYLEVNGYKKCISSKSKLLVSTDVAVNNLYLLWCTTIPGVAFQDDFF
jgi:hypothetical protein